MSRPSQIRLLLVEDVPQVAQYIRQLLEAQAQIKLVDTVTDGARALGEADQLRPDVIIVDVLLQGRVKGPTLIEQLHGSPLGIPVVALTVPQKPVQAAPVSGKPVYSPSRLTLARPAMLAMFVPLGTANTSTRRAVWCICFTQSHWRAFSDAVPRSFGST